MVGLDTRQTMVYQIFAFLFFLIALSWRWTFLFSDRFTAKRVLPKFATAGEPVSYRLKVVSLAKKSREGLAVFEELTAPCPTLSEFLNVAEPGEEKRNIFDRYMGVYRWRWLLSRREGARIPEQALPKLAPGGAVAVRVSFTPKRRGFLRFSGVLVARPDPFGLFYGLFPVAAPDVLLVLPRRYPVPPLKFAGSRRHQSGGVALAGSVGESEEFVSLREYRPGDPLRRIHWRSWAKRDKPVVKEFQEEYFVRYALVLDTFLANGEGGDALPDGALPDDIRTDDAPPDDELLEGAVSVAASFTCTLTEGESLLDILFVGPAAFCFTAGRSVAPVEGALEILASVGTSSGKPFGILSELVSRRAPQMSGCILILLAWDEERKRLVANLKNLGVPLRVLVMRSGARELPLGPMADEPENLIPVDPQHIEAGLAGLK